MPTVTPIYPASAAGGHTQTIAVDQGQVVVVSLARADGQKIDNGNLQCRVQRRVNTDKWQGVPGDIGLPAFLTGDALEIVISAPGFYRLAVPQTPWPVLLEEHR